MVHCDLNLFLFIFKNAQHFSTFPQTLLHTQKLLLFSRYKLGPNYFVSKILKKSKNTSIIGTIEIANLIIVLM